MTPRREPPSVHALALAAVGGLLLAAAAALPLDAPPLSLFACPFRAATHLPCPGCGCTRAGANGHDDDLPFGDVDSGRKS